MGGFLEGERGVGESLCPELLADEGASGEKGKWRRNENEVEEVSRKDWVRKKCILREKRGEQARRDDDQVTLFFLTF